jgi:hypothetical protein
MNADEIEARRMDIFREVVARSVSNDRSAYAAAKDALDAVKAFDNLFQPNQAGGQKDESAVRWPFRILAETYFTAAEGAIGALSTHGSYQGTGDIHDDAFGNMVICALLVEYSNGVKRVVLGHVFPDPWFDRAAEGVKRNAAKENALRSARQLSRWV